VLRERVPYAFRAAKDANQAYARGNKVPRSNDETVEALVQGKLCNDIHCFLDRDEELLVQNGLPHHQLVQIFQENNLPFLAEDNLTAVLLQRRAGTLGSAPPVSGDFVYNGDSRTHARLKAQLQPMIEAYVDTAYHLWCAKMAIMKWEDEKDRVCCVCGEQDRACIGHVFCSIKSNALKEQGLLAQIKADEIIQLINRATAESA
jgi:hypothetical protein